jgi:hypothetical protein
MVSARSCGPRTTTFQGGTRMETTRASFLANLTLPLVLSQLWAFFARR